ncbi:DNA replication licensing factor mcm6 [Ceratobasidium sp. AG-Ba]|nr:DNA replication licensing factor mcm6 [Ceratobasidium sp. AG-Ba]
MDFSDASSPAVPASSAVTPAADNANFRDVQSRRMDKRARNAFEGNIPVVTDPTADRLRERFYQFLTDYNETVELPEGEEQPAENIYVAQVRAMVE